MKRFIISLVALVIIFGVVVLSFAYLPTSTRAITASVSVEDKALIERGKYVATAADCAACHTRPDGESYAGGLAIASPVGTIYTTNITPDKQYGIGDYTLDQFDRAVRHGIRADGSSLYPAMPYPDYAHLTDEDIRALYAYFQFGDIKPVNTPNRPVDIDWPMSMRWPLAIWRKLFGPAPDDVALQPNQYGSEQIARGAYLVQGPGHCSSCHTPRGVALQEKAVNDASEEFLSGGQVVEGWTATNLRGDVGSGLGDWSEQDIVDTLRTGRNSHSAVVGQPMADVVVHSTQWMTEQDLKAIAAYLKTLSASGHMATSYVTDSTTAKALQAGQNDGRGAELYVDNCAGCHRTDAQGYPHAFPAIAANTTVLTENPNTLIRLILAGGSLPSTQMAPSPMGMPGFAKRLDNAEVAQLVSYIRNHWGNKASNVSAEDVAKVRRELEQATESSDAG